MGEGGLHRVLYEVSCKCLGCMFAAKPFPLPFLVQYPREIKFPHYLTRSFELLVYYLFLLLFPSLHIPPSFSIFPPEKKGVVLVIIVVVSGPRNLFRCVCPSRHVRPHHVLFIVFPFPLQSAQTYYIYSTYINTTQKGNKRKGAQKSERQEKTVAG